MIVLHGGGGGAKLTRTYYVGHITINVAQNAAKYVQNNKKTFCNFLVFVYSFMTSSFLPEISANFPCAEM